MIKCSHEHWSFLSIIMGSCESKCTTRFELLPPPLLINKVQKEAKVYCYQPLWLENVATSLWTVNFNFNQPTYTQLPRGWLNFLAGNIIGQFVCFSSIFKNFFLFHCTIDFTLFLSIIIMYSRVRAYSICNVLAIQHDLNLI